MRSVELFAGAGGLALGTARAGFGHQAVVEWNSDACRTLQINRRRGIEHVRDWPIYEADVTGFDFRSYEGVDLLSGGPPCQPFSIGGKHAGHRDRRNLFPAVARAVREIKPKAVLLENVPGLIRPAFQRYFEYILLQLTFPEVERRAEEDWTEHCSRLEGHRRCHSPKGLVYDMAFRPLSAADFGVPQRRERVFVVGFRADLGIQWSFPKPTHSLDALLMEQFVTGEYWCRHRISPKEQGSPPGRFRRRVDRLRDSLFPIRERPWRTVRDALAGLPDPEISNGFEGFSNHVFNPGARVYKGHTGSPLDEPAKTLKAGDHGVPGGENMISFPDGRVRYLTVRESARLQTFPDDYYLSGSWTEAMRQLGNAVPVTLAEALASSIARQLRRVVDREGRARLQPAGQKETGGERLECPA